MFEFTEDTEVIESVPTGKRERYGYDYVSTRKAYDRSLSLSQDYGRIDRQGKASRRASKRSENRNAINQAWKAVR